MNNSKPSPPWIQRFSLALCLHKHTHTLALNMCAFFNLEHRRCRGSCSCM